MDLVNSATLSLLLSRITQLSKFPTRISDCNAHKLVFFVVVVVLWGGGSFIAFDLILCSAVVFLPLWDSDHVVVSVYIDFPTTINEQNYGNICFSGNSSFLSSLSS